MDRRRALMLLAGAGVAAPASVSAVPKLVQSAKKNAMLVPISADMRRRSDNESDIGRALIRVARTRKTETLVPGNPAYGDFEWSARHATAWRRASPRAIQPGSRPPRLTSGVSCCWIDCSLPPSPVEPLPPIQLEALSADVVVDCEAGAWSESALRGILAVAWARASDVRWLEYVRWEQIVKRPGESGIQLARAGLRAAINAQVQANLPDRNASWVIPQRTFAWLAGMEKDGEPLFASLVADPPELTRLPVYCAYMSGLRVVRACMAAVLVSDEAVVRLEWVGKAPAGDIVRVTQRTGIYLRDPLALVGVDFQ